jgi:ribosomal protein S18 acetylase RimI-like enzyme
MITTPRVSVAPITEFTPADLSDISDATVDAIEGGGGFGWLNAPPRHLLESYWKGTLLVSNNELHVARLDDVICGAAQLQRPPRSHEARALVAKMTGMFVAPWARRHGVGRLLAESVEAAARKQDFAVLQLDVRETQQDAIRLFSSLNYYRWGIDPHYARVGGRWIEGYYYTKQLKDLSK